MAVKYPAWQNPKRCFAYSLTVKLISYYISSYVSHIKNQNAHFAETVFFGLQISF